MSRSSWIATACLAAGAVVILLLTHSLDAAVAGAVAGAIAVALAVETSGRSRISQRVEPSDDASRSSGEIARNAALIAGIPIPILVVEQGRIVEANASATELLGNHILGADVRLAIRNPAALDLILSERTREVSATIEMVGLGGAEQRWSMRIVPLANETKLLALLDQSGRHAAERMRVDFVANASHELRTPLAGILGFIETLRDPVAGADAKTRERFLSIMDGEARRMQRLVDDLMSLSRIEADKYRAPASPVGLTLLAEEVADVFRNRTDFAGRGIEIISAPDLPPVRGDRPQISQLLHNLVSNAIKYGAAGTPITISLTSAERDMVRLTVTDRGEGIPPEHIPRLTERFYRVDSGRSRAMGGTGLGLAIVKHIVERHRGRLDLTSTVGKGTTVTIDLPIYAESELSELMSQN
ncbi:ATP-binding protein [Sphingobium sp. CR28]|uniref:ATP-binding protein n=1 Tax=Sphingobium sp. CR28 TaxID=3400272 RepID=UPI003FEE696E